MRKIWKRVMSISLALAIIILCAPIVPASAAITSGSCGRNAYWNYDKSTATLTISGEGDMSDYSVLDVETRTSTDPAPWSEYMSEVETIVIEEGITSIGQSAFKLGKNLKHIELPNTLRRIYNFAFTYCYKVERVVIPAGVYSIGCNVFFGGKLNGGDYTPYIYFLGEAPLAKANGTSGRSFSDDTTVYFLRENAAEGSSWNGYSAGIWDGANFVDPLYLGEENGDEELPVESPWGSLWESWDNDNGDYQLEITGTRGYEYAYDVIDKLNLLRDEQGLSALSADDRLMEVAMRRAAECAVYFSHTRPNDTSALSIFPSAGCMGENIAAGQYTPSEVMNSWTNSSGHYQNMINDCFTKVGVGCFYTSGTYYWVQAFSDGRVYTHEKAADREVTEEIQLNKSHLLLRTDNSKLVARVGEKTQVPLEILNTGFQNRPTAIDPLGSVSCNRPSFVDIVNWHPLTIQGSRAGGGDMTVTLWEEAATTFSIEIKAPFGDVDSQSWYFDAVNWATGNGLIDPASDIQFQPDGLMTRATTAILLYRLEGRPYSNDGASFSDINDYECATAAKWTSAAGIMQGYGGNRFGPNDSLTREQMATVLFRYAQYKGWDVSARNALLNYSDASEISSFAVDAMKWANASGYITGTTTTTLAPAKGNSRAEAATIFMRFSENH